MWQGKAGINPETDKVAGPDFGAQARQAFLNLSAALQACGSNMDKAVQTTVFLTDASKFPVLNELFSKTPPTRSSPIVQLPKGLLFSIKCIALA
ncbi:MAG: RidA family protein [Candidatus Heimdallarchaeota archaeon]|nr:RidA family protein [Candidatus Heimdallarchaeota archaeon]